MLFNALTPDNIYQAYEICVRRDLLKEQVFILGRMGNAKQALAVIINKLGDIEEVPIISLYIFSCSFGVIFSLHIELW